MKDTTAPAGPPVAVPEEGPTTPAARPGGTRTLFRGEALEAGSTERTYGPPVDGHRLLPRRTRAQALGNTTRAPRRRVRRIPVRFQAQTSDCGAACLAMVLALHGVDIPVSELREATATGRDGVSARRLLEVARTYGFHGRGLKVSVENLRDLPPGTILFWNFNHFVVLEGVRGSWVHLVDPQHGRRRMTLEAVGAAFTGVALQITPALDDAGGKPRRTLRASRSADGSARSAGTAGPWHYVRYFLPHSRRHWIPFTLCSLLLLGFGLATPLATQYLIEHVAPGRPLHGAGLLGVGLILLVTVYLILQFLRSLSFLSVQTAVDERVTLGILDRLFSLPYGFFSSRTPGDLHQRVRTSSTVRQVLSASAFSSMFDGLLVLVYMALLLVADPLLALLVIVVALAQVTVLLLSWRRQEYASADALESLARAESELAEMLDGMQTLKSAGMEDVAAQRWSHVLAEELNARLRSRRLLALSSGISAALQFGAPLLVLLAGAFRISAGTMSPGKVLAFSVLAMGLFVPLANLVQIGLQVSGLGASLSRLGDIMEAPQERKETDRPVDVAGSISVQGVSFAYQADAPTLQDVTFDVPLGSFTTLLGASGSGKSSCALLLAGLHRPSSGRILVDGADLVGADTAAYRRSISFVAQGAQLFVGSIRDNIAWGGVDATNADVAEAARLAGIHDVIESMPMGYSTMLGPAGTGLSGGQRQRLVLARALVRRPRLLILDEATSALDPVSERLIFERLTALGCTLVVVAHRLTAVEDADQVVVLDRGRVVQTGRHRELLALDGPYKELVGG